MPRPPFVDSKPSPIPVTPEELAAAVNRIDIRTKQVLEVNLPRLEGGIELLDTRVSRLESVPEHSCVEGPRQTRQDDDILNGKVERVELAERIRGLVSFRNVIVGSILTVAGAAIWFALATTNSSSSHAEKIEANKTNITRHEQILAELPRKSDIENLRKSVSKDVSNIPNAMRELDEKEPPTPAEIEKAAKNLRTQEILKAHEYDTIRFILSRAEKRENGGSNHD